MTDERPAKELARDRRRDRDAHAKDRAGMRAGLAKGFRQIADAQARRARELRDRLDRTDPRRGG